MGSEDGGTYTDADVFAFKIHWILLLSVWETWSVPCIHRTRFLLPYALSVLCYFAQCKFSAVSENESFFCHGMSWLLRNWDSLNNWSILKIILSPYLKLNCWKQFFFLEQLFFICMHRWDRHASDRAWVWRIYC